MTPLHKILPLIILLSVFCCCCILVRFYPYVLLLYPGGVTKVSDAPLPPHTRFLYEVVSLDDDLPQQSTSVSLRVDSYDPASVVVILNSTMYKDEFIKLQQQFLNVSDIKGTKIFTLHIRAYQIYPSYCCGHS